MRQSNLDPTGGETARAMRLRPGAAHPVTDPTDPRYGRPPLPTRGHAEVVRRVVDPTDPSCARRAD